MPDKKVPTLDALAPDEIESARFSEIELRLLDAGAKSKENLNRETDQRLNLRRISVCVGVCLILGMSYMLYHISHSVFTPGYTEKPTLYLVAALIAPILSMTTISIALLVAAFRGFKDSDRNSGVAMATEAVRGTGMLS